MRLSFRHIVGPDLKSYPTRALYEDALAEADGVVTAMLASLSGRYTSPRVRDERMAWCKAPCVECFELEYAIPTLAFGAPRFLCTRHPVSADMVPAAMPLEERTIEGTEQAFHTCSSYQPCGPRSKQGAVKGGQRRFSEPHVGSSRDDSVRRWLQRALAVSSLPEARAYINGEVPDDDTALIAELRKRARKEKPWLAPRAAGIVSIKRRSA